MTGCSFNIFYHLCMIHQSLVGLTGPPQRKRGGGWVWRGLGSHEGVNALPGDKASRCRGH